MPNGLHITSGLLRRLSRRPSQCLLAMGVAAPAFSEDPNHLVQTICIACHNEHTLQAGLNLQGFDANEPQLMPVIAEKMIRKLRAGQMPCVLLAEQLVIAKCE